MLFSLYGSTELNVGRRHVNPIWTSLIGLVGVILGVLLNEGIRRSRRIETFSPKLFEKRLKKYEQLMALLQAGYKVASDVMSNPAHPKEERHALISEAIHSIARFTDQEELYIDPELGTHCVATFMGAEDVLLIKDPKERVEAEQDVREMYKEAKRMIREDSGIFEIEKLFRSIYKPRITSRVIDRIRYLRAHPEELNKGIGGEDNL